MKRFTLIGIGLSVAAVAVPAAVLCERPAVAQATQPSNAEQRIRIAERSAASARVRVERADDAYKALKDKVADMEAQLHSLTHRAETSRVSLRKAASQMDEEAERLALEQAGADARQKALEIAIEQQAKRAEAAVQTDEVAAELQKVVDARTTQVKRMEQLQATGAIPNADVDGAMAALAEARARLAERRQHTAAAAGGAALADWNRELLNLSVANAERHAKLKFLEDRREGLATALRAADDVSDYKDAMDGALRDRDKAARELKDSEEMLRNLKAALPTTRPQRD